MPTVCAILPKYLMDGQIGAREVDAVEGAGVTERTGSVNRETGATKATGGGLPAETTSVGSLPGTG